MNERFTLHCIGGLSLTEAAPEIAEVHEFASCLDAIRNARAFVQRQAPNRGARAEVWLNRSTLLWCTDDPFRAIWDGPAAVGRYAITFNEESSQAYHLVSMS